MLLAGTATFTGDGVTKSFNIVTGLSYTPTLIQLTAGDISAVSTSGGTVINNFYVDAGAISTPGTIPVTFVNAPDLAATVIIYWTAS